MQYYDIINDTITPTGDGNNFLVPLGIEQSTAPNTAIKDGAQFAWDSTSIGLFKTCPYKYKLTIIDGWHHKVVPPALAYGIFIHRLFQAWHQLIALDIPKETALLNCVKLAGLLGEHLPAGDTARQKEQLIRAAVWYFEQFWDDPAETVILSNGKPAVEYSFTLPFFKYLDQQVYLCGHIDRFAKWQGRVLAADYKTTKYGLDNKFFNKFKPSTQFPLYIAASHIIASETQELKATDGILLDGIQVGVNFNRYARYVVPYSPEEINHYLEGLQYWIKRAMDAGREGYFPPNEESCDKYGGCPFRDICNKPPVRHEAYIKGHFVKRTWDPLKER